MRRWEPITSYYSKISTENSHSLTLSKNSSRSSAVFLISPLLEFWTSLAISFAVSWRNFAYSILAFSLLFNASYKVRLDLEQVLTVKDFIFLCEHNVNRETYRTVNYFLKFCACAFTSKFSDPHDLDQKKDTFRKSSTTRLDYER